MFCSGKIEAIFLFVKRVSVRKQSRESGVESRCRRSREALSRKAAGGLLNGLCTFKTFARRNDSVCEVRSVENARSFEHFPERVESAQEEQKKSATALILAFETPGFTPLFKHTPAIIKCPLGKRRESVGRLARSASLSIPLRRLLH